MLRNPDFAHMSRVAAHRVEVIVRHVELDSPTAPNRWGGNARWISCLKPLKRVFIGSGDAGAFGAGSNQCLE